MLVVGHRGVAGRFPENTLVSIAEAAKLGLEWVEVDVQPTLDEELVICHDHTVNRCSNGKGRVDEQTLETLKHLDFGSWFSEDFAHQSILTLDELLAFAEKAKLKVNLEVKIDRHDAERVCQILKRYLDKSSFPSDHILLSSFNHQIIRHLHQQLPHHRLAVLSERLKPSDKRLLKEVSAFGCNLNYRWVTKSHIRYLKEHDYQVWCYTVNNPNALKHLSGLDGIFSDFPERFL
ncbi:glycerophosphoryl diester phosphodiesterase [Vibrio sp. RE86]|uniref:glycerophosphodiester phosphodiesterase family protein n=1 Tax=Vibrio sp. RE86 TaxID=2607605 RepID=UPI0014933A77|nr:glycerophosphodiester phosphodiesterase family protein [Vibrio sp. RE86]NOH79642.1 glycerophosphoryl diester phosphodiesterase [Vibrio sp. RE86]